jgi:dienelactone hydrolase
MSEPRVTYEDILNLEKPCKATISPKGEYVTYVVEKSNIEENRITHTLYLHNKSKQSTKIICIFDRIMDICWNGDVCYFLVQDKNKYKLLHIQHEDLQEDISSEIEIGKFTVSADNAKIYFTQLIQTSPEVVKKHREQGYVYRWGFDTSSTIIDRQYQHYEFEQIWCLDTLSKEKHFVTQFSWDGWMEWKPLVTPLIKSIALSSSGSYLAVCLNRLGDPQGGEAAFQFELKVHDIKQNKSFSLLANCPSSKETPCWLSDQELVFQEESYNNEDEQYKICLWNALKDETQCLSFFNSKDRLKSISYNNQNCNLYAESDKGIYKISLPKQEVIFTPLPFLACTYSDPALTWDQSFNWLATIIEDRNNPPQVILRDIANDESIVISDLNKNVKDLQIAEIEPITIEIESNDSGTVKAQGYLLHPLDEIQGEQYPLIIATYGFTGKSCAINAEEWHSSFPAQVLASQGYFVFLLNCPPSKAQSNITNHAKARETEGWQMLRIFEQAVSVLDQRGCIDTDKVGIYGWSHGAFIVEFLIGHSSKFKVACLGEGGDYNPGAVWSAGNSLYVNINRNLFGGTPWDITYLQNYVEFSPVYQVSKISAPVLMEFCGGAVNALEMYVPLRTQETPAELVFYDDEDHIFKKPKSRLSSMKRKVEWFNFWFYDKRDPTKAEQYERWDKMR